MAFTIRGAGSGDLPALLALYSHLHGNPIPEPGTELHARTLRVWRQIMADPRHSILLGFDDGRAVSTCVAAIVPNLTHGARPYMLIENVVTLPDCRGRGYATLLLQHAQRLAREAGCYKIMLLTGSKQDSTLRFYERAGFNRADKTGFIMWLEQGNSIYF